MFSIKPLLEFTSWLDALTDKTVRGAVLARVKRLEFGLMGDTEPVGEGVSELRIQKADIKRARALAGLLDDEGNEDGQTN